MEEVCHKQDFVLFVANICGGFGGFSISSYIALELCSGFLKNINNNYRSLVPLSAIKYVLCENPERQTQKIIALFTNTQPYPGVALALFKFSNCKF